MSSKDSSHDDINYVIFSVDYDTAALTKVSELVDKGALKPLITKRIDVKDLKTAHESYLRGENNGKIIVVVDQTIE